MEQLEFDICELDKLLGQLEENKKDWEFAKRFGFTQPQFDKYGWLKSLLEVVDTIPFPEVNANCGVNNIVIGRGPNGLYAYGLHINATASGYGSSPTIFDKPFTTYEEARRAAFEEFKLRIPRHFTQISDKATAAKFTKFIDQMLNE